METPQQPRSDEQPLQEPQPCDETPLLPRPMHTRPALQAMAWVGGVTAGGIAFMTLLGLTSTRTRGATQAARAQWQLRHGGIRQVAPTEPSDAVDADSTALCGVTGLQSQDPFSRR